MSWIVAAGPEHARIFELQGSEVTLVHEVASPTSVDAHVEELCYARAVAQRLRDARLAGKFERLVLIAPEPLLHALRGTLDPVTRHFVVAAVNHDAAELKPQQVLHHLPSRARN